MYPGDTHEGYFFGDDVRPFRLSAKEIAKASTDGATIVSRRQPDGRYLVCAVNTAGERKGLPIGPGLNCQKHDVSKACQQIGRALDKFYGRGEDMSDKARHREWTL